MHGTPVKREPNRRERVMKHYVIVFVMLLAVAAVATSARAQNIPEPSGQYAVSIHGSLAVCLNPDTGATEACSASKAVPYPLTFVEIGTITYGSGVGCESDYQVVTPLPPANMPATVTLNAHAALKLTSYDRARGVGTGAFTSYTGGSCDGTSFDSSGATETGTGTYQIVVTEGGRHNDVLITQDTALPVNDLNSISLYGAELKQTR
jgi:hypothetical protein